MSHEALSITGVSNATGGGSVQQQIFHISKHDGSGSVVGLSQGSFSIQDDASGTPGCNAALDRTRGVYHKTAIRLSTYEPGNCTDTCPSGSTCCKDPSAKGDDGSCFSVPSCAQIPDGAGLGGGDLLSIDIDTGKVVSNITMVGTPHHPPSLAFSERTGLAYGVVPYAYTEYGIFSYNLRSGAVTQLNTMKKGSMDGIGNCIGGVLELNGTSLLWYQRSEGHNHTLLFVDLSTMQEVQRIPGFYMTAEDPSQPGTLLGLTNTEPGVALVRLSPMANTSTTLFSLRTTTLGSDLRAQDQASLAVDDAGTTVWFAASYNTASGKLYRGIFTLGLAGDSNVTLKSQHKFFGEPDDNTTIVGRIDWV